MEFLASKNFHKLCEKWKKEVKRERKGVNTKKGNEIHESVDMGYYSLGQTIINLAFTLILEE